MEHLVDRPVEQLEVVGDDQDGTREPLELLHQPPLGRKVEMVGGLVEDHGVGPLEEDPDQVDPSALATREALDVVEQELLAEAEAVGQAGHRRLGLVAAVLPELLLEVGEELDVLGRRVLAHLGAGLVEGVVEDVEAPARQDVGEAVGLESEAVGHRHLGQVAEGAPDAGVPGGPHVPPGLVDDHRDEGRFSGAVAADQGDLLARADHERGVAEQGPVTDFDSERGADDHQEGGDHVTTGTYPRIDAGELVVIEPRPVSHTRGRGTDRGMGRRARPAAARGLSLPRPGRRRRPGEWDRPPPPTIRPEAGPAAARWYGRGPCASPPGGRAVRDRGRRGGRPPRPGSRPGPASGGRPAPPRIRSGTSPRACGTGGSPGSRRRSGTGGRRGSRIMWTISPRSGGACGARPAKASARSRNSHGRPRQPRPTTTPSHPVAATMARASDASHRSPLPRTGMEVMRALSSAMASQSALPE